MEETETEASKKRNRVRSQKGETKRLKPGEGEKETQKLVKRETERQTTVKS